MAWYRGFRHDRVLLVLLLLLYDYREDCPDGRLTPEAFMHVYGTSFLSANTKGAAVTLKMARCKSRVTKHLQNKQNKNAFWLTLFLAFL